MRTFLFFFLLFMPVVVRATPDSLSTAERTVQEIIREKGIYVVHFWAPWCPNSRSELGAGWPSLIADNPDVHFLFVTVWNNGQSGRKTLRDYGIPDTVPEIVEEGTSPVHRSQRFLGLPLTWTPSTWIFHRQGHLAYALNYGEVDMDTLQKLIDMARKDWSHGGN